MSVHVLWFLDVCLPYGFTLLPCPSGFIFAFGFAGFDPCLFFDYDSGIPNKTALGSLPCLRAVCDRRQ